MHLRQTPTLSVHLFQILIGSIIVRLCPVNRTSYLLSCLIYVQVFSEILTNFSVLSSVLLCFLPPSLCHSALFQDCALPSAAASISAVTAGTHPASAAMLSYSILPVCVCIYVCECE